MVREPLNLQLLHTEDTANPVASPVVRFFLSICFLGVFAGSDTPDRGPLQLVDGPNSCAGRVEVLHDHQWGTVCDDGWDLTDAGVVCKQLGCGTAVSAPGKAYFGRGHERIWLDEVNCTGLEAALSDCQASSWGKNNCYHGEDASVVCSGSSQMSL